MYINSTNIPPIMIINRISENQYLLSLELVSFLVRLRTYQHPCILFDASLVIYIYINNTNIPPIMIINRIYENWYERHPYNLNHLVWVWWKIDAMEPILYRRKSKKFWSIFCNFHPIMTKFGTKGTHTICISWYEFSENRRCVQYSLASPDLDEFGTGTWYATGSFREFPIH